MSNTINDMRDVLFETLRALKDKEKPMEIDRALAIKDVAQVIVNSAKVEVDHMKIAGGAGSGFIVPAARPALPGETTTERTGSGTKTTTHLAGATITRHKMAG